MKNKLKRIEKIFKNPQITQDYKVIDYSEECAA